MAMSFSSLIKMVPKGAIQSFTNLPPQLKELISRPNNTPRTIPITICQWRGSFFIFSQLISFNRLLSMTACDCIMKLITG